MLDALAAADVLLPCPLIYGASVMNGYAGVTIAAVRGEEVGNVGCR